jgi:DNA-binding transcriptional regulator YdaS (Cro superfamily)
MDNGFQGIFLLLVLVFWILEGILSARRKRQGVELPGEIQPPGEVPGVPPGGVDREEIPDREVWQDGTNPREGYRTLPERPSGRPMTWGERHGEASPPGQSPVPGQAGEKAEGMIPKGLWEELAAMARGERPTPPEPAPAPAPVESEPRGSGAGQGRSIEEAAAARKRDGYDLPTRRREWAPAEPRRDVVGSDAAMAARVRHTPALRLSPEQVPTVSSSSPAGRKGGILRSLAGGVTSRELRRAVILHEILGPPVALRGIEWESQEGQGVRRPGLG